MPLIRRGKLLAGVAALFALSVAGPGCRTNDVCKTCNPMGEDGSGMQRSPVARISFPIRSQPTTGEPAGASTPSAIMLRPVPMGESLDTQNAAASTWAPVQRVSGEITAPQESDLLPVASIGSPLPATLTSSQAGSPLIPVPTSPALAGRAADAPDAKEKEKEKPRNVLPMPKESAKKTGYPDLGPVMITQPMDAPREFQMRALSTYIVEPPDILLVELYLPALRRGTIRAEQLVRPDGTIGFSAFPPVFVAGLTLEQIKRQLAETILPHLKSLEGRDDEKNPKPPTTLDELLMALKVDVLRYNSKFYYVISDGGGYGAQVTKVPLTGNERVLDAVATIQGLPAVSSKKKIWVARATPHDYDHPIILPVDWCGIAQRGMGSTNFQMFPGDRLYIQSDARIRADSQLAKFLAPVERILGVTLLGSGVVNSIKNGGNNGGGSNNGITGR